MKMSAGFFGDASAAAPGGVDAGGTPPQTLSLGFGGEPAVRAFSRKCHRQPNSQGNLVRRCQGQQKDCVPFPFVHRHHERPLARRSRDFTDSGHSPGGSQELQEPGHATTDQGRASRQNRQGCRLVGKEKLNSSQVSRDTGTNSAAKKAKTSAGPVTTRSCKPPKPSMPGFRKNALLSDLCSSSWQAKDSKTQETTRKQGKNA